MSAVRLGEHFEDLEKQGHAGRLGMWIFLSSELMLFAALFTVYAVARATYPAQFDEGARHAALWLGSANTAILLTSSLFAALAVHAAGERRSRACAGFLAAAAALGAAFLALKGVEYATHIREGLVPGVRGRAPGEAIYFTLYYTLTGLHALHVAGGICVLLWLARRARRGAFGPARGEHVALEAGALYWHLVDMVWIFLWPMFYLVR